MNQRPNEPMDFDPWRWVAIPLWGLVLLVSPVAVAIGVWRSAGALPALAVAICSFLVLRFLFSNRLLQSWHFTAALNGRHIVELMPVLMIRLRLEDDREVQLRMKGQLVGGSLMEGDRISAAGSWRGGVLHVRHVLCERTGARTVPKQPSAFGLAVAGTCALLTLCLWLGLIGVPWASQRMRPFRDSIGNNIPNMHTSQFRR